MDEEAIFDAAIDLPPDARPAFLDEACGEDHELRKRVEALLQSFDQPSVFMRGNALAVAGLEPLVEGPGSKLGPYRLIEQIGEGGMGIVYVAEQTEPVQRQVALKIIRPGLDTREVMSRFATERQALAMMDHPNIAKVLDAGATDSGRPYFVMELVDGLPVTQFCDRHRYDSRQRLALFVDICQATKHAHQKGIIHRDIKPTNVLVAVKGERAVVKVIDFGVAKAVDRRQTERTVVTQFAQVLGTPLYMSPEQAEAGNQDIDTRTDIYSLGVLLYELLTGTTPFDKVRLREAAYDEMRRIICEEEPPKPSTKISTLGDEAKPASQVRGTEPTRLCQQLRGELDWIVMKALEKERERRYDSAGAFADDVRRFLNDEPVAAGPPGPFYRLRKFVHRNRASVISAAAAMAALLLGTVAISLAWLDARQARDLAQNAFRSEQLQRTAADRNLGFSRVAGAFLSYQLNEPHQAMSKLHEVRRSASYDSPTWEWNYVNGLLNFDLMTASVGTAQAPWVSCLEFSADGHLLAAGSAVSEYVNARPGAPAGLVVLDTETHKLVSDFSKRQSSVHCLAFSPDKERLFVAAENTREDLKAKATYSITCWNLDEEEPLWSRQSDQAAALRVIEPEDQLIVIANNTLEIWDARSGVPIWPATSDESAHPGINTDDVSWETVRGQRIVGRRRRNDAMLEKFAFSLNDLNPENNQVTTSSGLRGPLGQRAIRRRRTKELDVFDLESGAQLDTLRSSGGDFFDYDFSPDGKWVATGNSDNSVTLWDLTTGRPEIALRGHANRVHSMAYTPTGERLATGDWDGTIKIWDTTRAPEVLDLHWTWPYVAEDLAFSSDDREVAVAKITSHRYGGRFYRYDSQSGINTLHGTPALSHRNANHTHIACFSSDATRLFGVDREDASLVRAWDTTTAEQVADFQAAGPVHIVRSDASGLRLATCANAYPGSTAKQAGDVLVWDVATAQPKFAIREDGMEICSLAISPDGKRVVIAFGGRYLPDNHTSSMPPGTSRLEVWDIESNKRSHAWARSDSLGNSQTEVTMNIHTDNRTLVYLDWGEGVIRFIDLLDGNLVREFHASDLYHGFALNPDGTRLAAINRRAVVLLDATNGHRILTLPGKPQTRDYVQNPQVVFSHDGQYLAGIQWDSSVWVWGHGGNPKSLTARQRRQRSGRERFLNSRAKVKLTEHVKQRQSRALARLKAAQLSTRDD